MFTFLLLIAWVVYLAIQANEGWVKTKEAIQRGENPSIFLILYTSLALLFLLGFLLFFYFRMIYREQEKYKNPVAAQNHTVEYSGNQPPSPSGEMPGHA